MNDAAVFGRFRRAVESRTQKALKQKGDWWNGHCPAHEDTAASFSCRAGDQGVVVKCHAGCSTEDVCAAVGWQVKDLFYKSADGPSRSPRPSPAKPAGKTDRKPAPKRRGRLTIEQLAADKGLDAEFLRSLDVAQVGQVVHVHYHHADGSRATRVRVRDHVKASKGSRWTPGEAALIPYGLDRLGAAREAGYVIVVEGESDCWVLWRAGLPAVGLPGASQSGKLELQHLEGIGTVYLSVEPDKAGRKLEGALAERLREIGYTGRALRVRWTADEGDPAGIFKRTVEEIG